MNPLIKAGLVVLWANVALAQEFWLTNSATGEKWGPFEFRDGAGIVLSNQTFVIRKILTDDQKVIEKMKKIVVPEVEWREANIHDVLEFLIKVTSEDEPGKAKRSQGLCTIMITEPAPITRPFTGDDPFASMPETNSMPEITLNARDISIFDLVEIVSKQAGLTWKVDGKVVVFWKQGGKPATPPNTEPARQDFGRLRKVTGP